MYVEREIGRKFGKIAGIYGVVAVVGARQSGKTTFLKERSRQVNSSYVLFDDPDARALFEDDIKKFEKQYVEGHEVTVLDEVQYCRDAGIKLKYLADKGRKLWVTSSSEIILGKEILSYLVGRVSILRLYPFSLDEFLLSKGQKALTDEILRRNIWEHMTYGGYPKVVLTDDIELKKTILRDLFETMLLKDVARTFSIEDIRTLEDFTRYLAINIGGVLSYEKISREIKTSFQTMKKYLDAMEKSYIIVRVQPYFTNKSKEITKQPKIYFLDTGMRNIVAKEFSADVRGNLFENCVLSELLKLGFVPKCWRSKANAEVDFVIEKDNEIIPIEVKISVDPKNVERSLRSFIISYKPKKAIVIFYKGTKGSLDVNGCKVVFTDMVGMKELLSE